MKQQALPFALLALLLIGCTGDPAGANTPTAEDEIIVTGEVTIPTPALLPTATATPTPTPTPTPSPRPPQSGDDDDDDDDDDEDDD